MLQTDFTMHLPSLPHRFRHSNIIRKKASAKTLTAPGDSQNSADKEQSQRDKAQARRAQVRKAQIQHRQRKANYVAELEVDVAKFRDLIGKTEQEASTLRRENAAIKKALMGAGINSLLWVQDHPRYHPTGSPAGAVPQLDSPQMDVTYGQPLSTQMMEQHMQEYDAYPQQQGSTELFSGIDIDDLTVTLSVDDTMGTPCLNISSNSSGASVRSVASPPPRMTECKIQLSPSQEQTAINFILA